MANESDRIVLTPDERKELRRLMRSPRAEQREALRASIVWYLAVNGMNQAEVAAKLDITRKTVAKWEGRFLTQRLPGLGDLPRLGALTHFSVEQRCQVLSIACADPSDFGLDGQTCWTLDTLTAVTRSQGIAMSRSTVARTLERNDLKPHKMRMWLHSPDPAFREKVNEIV